jgi:hypothetical protein
MSTSAIILCAAGHGGYLRFLIDVICEGSGGNHTQRSREGREEDSVTEALCFVGV